MEPATAPRPLTDLQQPLLQLVEEQEGITQRELAQQLGEKQQTVSYNLRVLERRNLIGWKREGGQKHYFLS